MVNTTETYKKAVVADSRRVRIKAIVDLSDPDLVYEPAESANSAPWSNLEQIRDKVMEADNRYATMEKNRTLLNKSFKSLPDDFKIDGQIGYVSGAVANDSAQLSNTWVEDRFSGVRVLQMVKIIFSDDPADGVPEDFTVDIYSGSTSYHTETITGNQDTTVTITGFTVQLPTAVRVTCTKMSLPSRRLRVVEMLTGLYDEWGANILSQFSITQESDFSCLTLPYGRATVAMDNTSKLFDPRDKNGIFQSIEERQSMELFIGMDLEDKTTEFLPMGRFYMAGDGWKTSTGSATMRWDLVDIIGLVSMRAFVVPDTLPTTLNGWIAAVMSQLGFKLETQYKIDPNYSSKAVTANSKEDVTDVSCGDIIRWACMATGTWPRGGASDGKLTIEPLWNQGNKVTMEALESYPGIKANESIASLIFELADTNKTQYVVSGNSTSSEKTVTIQNPFLHNKDQALESARLILSCYGGNVIDTVGRGDPSSEIGDVDTVWLNESNATTARRKSHTFQIQDGVLQGCKGTLLQADGSYLWTEYEIITKNSTFKVPSGTNKIRLIIGQGGQGGGHGEDGYIYDGWDSVEAGYGENGTDGKGGLIWYNTVDVNPGQTFQVVIGNGGAAASTKGVPGAEGSHSTFGPYTSEDGSYYPIGYTDIANGLSFGRTGVESPVNGTSDGGKGGKGGDPGIGYRYQNEGDIGYRFKIEKPGGPGHPGADGASGFVMVMWEKD